MTTAGDPSTPDCIVVCGPTASGKTRLAVELAFRYAGEIISADSRQIYRGMDIGTGKDLDEYRLSESTRIAHHCIDIADPHEIYTLYHYLRDCTDAFYSIRAQKKLPIMAGGTGLYIEAFLKGYRVPNVPENPELRASLMSCEKADLEKRLKKLDPKLYKKTDLSSKKRIVRAIEIALFALDNDVNWGNESPPPQKPLVIGVNPPRSELYDGIDRRLNERLAQGMVDEVQRLIDSGLSRQRLALFGMEYKRIAMHLFGECDYREMVDQLRTDIHHLAKRQVTWFRGMQRRGIDIRWIERPDPEEASVIIESVSEDFPSVG